MQQVVLCKKSKRFVVLRILAALTFSLPCFDLRLRHQAAVLQALGLVTGFDDMAVVCKPIQQSGGHLGVAEHARPFSDAQVGGDHQPGVFVQLGQQVKQQRAASLAERQIAQFVENDQIHAQQSLGDPPGFAVVFSRSGRLTRSTVE